MTEEQGATTVGEVKTSQAKESQATTQRRYHVTHQLKKIGVVVDPEKRTISLSDEMKANLTKIQQNWVDELMEEHGHIIQSAIHMEPKIKSKMEKGKTGFFSQLLPWLEKSNFTLKITKGKEEKLSVSLYPDGTELPPLNLAGTVEEMDEEFFSAIETSLKKADEAGLLKNGEAFEEAIEGVKSRKTRTSPKDKPKKEKKEKPTPKPKKKPEPPPYYTDDEQKQIKTRLDSMRDELEKEEKGLLALVEAQPANKQYAKMLKEPQAKLKKVNEAMKQLEAKRLGLKGKKLVPVAQLVKNPF